jgi:hypothetical protein
MGGLIFVNKVLLTETDYIQITNMSKFQFVALINRLTLRDRMELRRALQVATTGYRARNMHTHTEPEATRLCVPCKRIWKAIGEMCQRLERESRYPFMYYKMKELVRYHPNWTRTARKIEAKRLWEQFCKANSY